MATNAKLTSKEISVIVRDYHAQLPEWHIVGGDTLLRFGRSIAQSLWFDRLRTGSYRPTARIHVLVAPDERGGTVVLPQFLGVKNKEVTKQAHARQLPSVIAALHSELSPSIDKSLDENTVVELAASRSHGRPAGAYAVACLYAALGTTSEARRWIREYHAAIKAVGIPEQPIDVSRSSFLKQLEMWIEKSIVDTELSSVIEREKIKLLAGG